MEKCDQDMEIGNIRVRWNVGNGRMISFWSDRWVDLGSTLGDLVTGNIPKDEKHNMLS